MKTVAMIFPAVDLTLLVFHVAGVFSLFALAFMRRWSSLGIRAMSRLAFMRLSPCSIIDPESE
jgi:hypothetical protein